MARKVAVLVPTRGRPDGLVKLMASVWGTSNADILAYVDEDQRDSYKHLGKSVRMVVGDRVGPVASANALVRCFPDYEVYGLMTDDCTVGGNMWDEWTLQAMNQFPRKMAVVSPAHKHGNHVDMPFVSKEWISTTGWYACPACHHYCWPIITGLIGEMTAIVHAPEQSFRIDHEYDPTANHDQRDKDYRAFFSYVSAFLPGVVDTIREAMNPEVGCPT